MRIRIHRTLLTIAFVIGTFVIGASLLIALAPGLIQAKARQDTPSVPAAPSYRFLPSIGNHKLPTPIAIAAGSLHTCALMSSGGVKCWGQNEFGQAGDNTVGDPVYMRRVPVDVKYLSGVQAITAGNMHTCALTLAGAVKCWGGNYFDEVGTMGDGYRCGYQGQVECFLVPKEVVGLSSGVKAIASQDRHTCVLTNEGGVKCWGGNEFGQVGDGNGGLFTSTAPIPMDVVGLSSGVKAIAVGDLHSCAVTEAGGVKCWGYNHNNKLGTATNGVVCGAEDHAFCHFTPADVVAFPSGVEAIAIGNGHTCVLTTMGAVKCWGYNAAGQLGNGEMSTEVTPPTTVIGLSDGVQAITASSGHTCALTLAGEVKCWGQNSSGQLGDGGGGVGCGFMGEEFCRLEPVAVSGLSSGVIGITAGLWHTCAVLDSGEAKCWGHNAYGQLGDQSRANQFTPAEVSWH